jgi:purine-cytosine permease-like protein
MGTTDDERDYESREGESFDDTFVAPPVRRSTYTPPPAHADASDAAVHDDDELANALAQDWSRTVTGSIPIVDREAAIAAEDPFAALFAPRATEPAEPVAPQPVAPAAPVDAAPAEPAPPVFEVPAPVFDLPTIDEPAGPVFDEPAPPVFEVPAAPVFDEPAAPVFEQPAPPVFEVPSAPAYEAPSYNAPTDEAPSYRAPFEEQEPAPVFEVPTFEVPSFDEPSTPVYDIPSFDERIPEAAAPAAAPEQSVPQFPAPPLDEPSTYETLPGPAAAAQSFDPSSFSAPIFEVPAPSYDPPAPSFDAPAPVFDAHPSPPVFDAPAAPAWEPTPWEPPAAQAPPVAEAPPVFVVEPSAPESSAISLTPEQQAEALQRLAGPAGPPWIPQRRSLPDSELMGVLEAATSGTTEGAMEELEQQLALREHEAKEYADWEQSMLAVGTPEALAAVEQVRPQFTGIVAPTPGADVAAPAPAEDSAPAADLAPSEAPIVVDEAPVAAHPEPAAWQPPAPVDEPAPAPTAAPDAFEWPAAFSFDQPAAPVADDVPSEEATLVAEPEAEQASDEPTDAAAPVEQPFSFDWTAPPAPEQPSSDAPVSDAPVFDAPAVDEPSADEPSAERPSFAWTPDPAPETAAEPAPEPAEEPAAFIDPFEAFLKSREEASAAEAAAAPPVNFPFASAEPAPEPETFSFAGPVPPAEPVAEEGPSETAPWEAPAAFEPAPPAFEAAPVFDAPPVADTPPVADAPPVTDAPPVIDAPPAFEVPAAFEPAPEAAPEPAPVEPPTAAPEPGSFGGLFNWADPEPEPAPAADSAQPPLDPALTETAPPPLVEPAPFDFSQQAASSDPFGFVQSLDQEPVTPAQSPEPPAPEPEEPTFASLFEQEPAAPEVAAPIQDAPPAFPPPSDAVPPPSGDLNFDDLLSGDSDPADPVFLEPRPFVDSADSERSESVVTPPAPAPTETARTETASTPTSDTDLGVFAVVPDLDDETDGIDDLDTSLPVAAAPVIAEETHTAPPVAATGSLAIVPVAAPVFRVETASLEPTPLERRVGHAARLFWLWFAANSSIVSIAFGAVIFSLGMSLRQAIVATLAGVALSFIPLGLGTLAGKRSAQPTMIVSRAVFGVTGNVVPAVLSLVTRIFWGAALLWILGASVAGILVGAQLDGGLGVVVLTMIAMAIGAVLAVVIAFFGYALIAKLQLVVSIVSGILIAVVIIFSWEYVDFPTALTTGDGPWVLVITGTVLVFSFVGLVWANSSSDLARYQRPGSSGAGSMLWSTFGTTVPTFVLIAYGAVLAASNPLIAGRLLENPVDTIGLMLPTWYPIPLIAVASLGLLSGVVVSIYSGGFALQSVGVRVSRSSTTLVLGLLVVAVSLLITVLGTDLVELFRDVATTLAVPVAAWAGIFAADVMIRNRRYDTESLLARGGIYPTVHWVNLPALLVITGIGFGLTNATLAGLTWQGYVFPLLGLSSADPLVSSDVGVLVALVLGLLVPIVSGIPSIRKQESARPAPN